ncbi:unnamed protein product [Lymnaea stagnalis]|uniref:Uncharacterized protein n=1 Tax=Lymnaea stagnalis TaxID=6523 RepID=A0AAV2I914_LYMST
MEILDIILMILLLLHFSLVSGQSVELFENSQKDCETQCVKGLVSGSDTVNFTAQVQYSDDPNMNILFFVKRNYDRMYQLLSLYNIHEDCNRNKYLTCTDVSQNVINITIRQVAFTELSEALIYVKLVTSSHVEIKSETRRFPLINNPSNTTGRLVINGQEITKDNDQCLSAISGNDLSIHFKCESQVLPCLIDVVFDDEEKHVQGTYEVKCNRKIKSQNLKKFTIYYGACKLEHTPKIKRCTISVTEWSTRNLPILLAVMVASSTFLICIIIFIIVRIILKALRNKLHLKQQLERKGKHKTEMGDFLPSHVNQSTQDSDHISLSSESTLYISAAED